MKTQGRAMLVGGILAVVAGILLALDGLLGDDDAGLVRGGLVLVMGLFAVWVSRNQGSPRR